MTFSDKTIARRFQWGEGCEGWAFVEAPNLHVQLELMPPGTTELLHRHDRTRQCYFVLDGRAAVTAEGDTRLLATEEAYQVAAGIPHKIANAGDTPLRFLVVSSQAPRSDRVDLE